MAPRCRPVLTGPERPARRARWRGQWRDAKGLRFSLLDGERIVHVRSGHQVQNAEQLGAALPQIHKAGLIPAEQVRLCVVCDGAAWIWKHVQALLPQARQVLDDYHYAQYLHRVAKAHYGASGQAVERVEATMTRLSLGKVGLVLDVCFINHTPVTWVRGPLARSGSGPEGRVPRHPRLVTHL
ncbi:MAG: transposase [Candidatus Tectomicrobia bacterium]|uniref:Transposase n=1 Tax=Tectimicrobiota bacterium TaxID=2528274 RepID=A0A938AZW2_UNCTE|nr:transposase [Candidatus Tectomicrobia bacterium]